MSLCSVLWYFRGLLYFALQYVSFIPLQESLTHLVNLFDRYLVYLLLCLVVQLHALLSTSNVISEVVMIEILPHVFQAVQQVA